MEALAVQTKSSPQVVTSGTSRIGVRKMNPRDTVLGAIRKNLPQPAVPLPEVQSFAHPGEPLLQARGILTDLFFARSQMGISLAFHIVFAGTDGQDLRVTWYR
jgi:hypothetical protein